MLRATTEWIYLPTVQRTASITRSWKCYLFSPHSQRLWKPRSSHERKKILWQLPRCSAGSSLSYEAPSLCWFLSTDFIAFPLYTESSHLLANEPSISSLHSYRAFILLTVCGLKLLCKTSKLISKDYLSWAFTHIPSNRK